MSFQYWYMFPVAIVVSTVSISSGVAGATFYTPIFLLWLGLPLRMAIGAALITATFGFASGLTGYVRRGLIDYRLGVRLMAASIPMAVLGVWLAARIDPTYLRVVFGVGLLAIAASFLSGGVSESKPSATKPEDETSPDRQAPDAGATNPHTAEGTLFAGIGGLFLGMISAGLGELNAFYLMKRRGMPSDVAIATSVLVIAGTVVAAASGHLIGFVRMGPEMLAAVGNLVMFTIPGVIIGAQIGCVIGSRAPRELIMRVLGVLFVIVATLIVYPVIA